MERVDIPNRVTIAAFNAALLKAMRADDAGYVRHLIHDFLFDETHAWPKADYKRASDFEGRKKYGV